ncbi:uncharacterized protein LOC116616096 [Nematostella vectensis]|uniref:uncharacterized protein LOC116616096 n=1 Tax=Nematostella vectensis TaxID=45351 RepID=UPI0013905319|nr:uncharacterized protein LOC116616096 [Nematostella vectensis]
MISTNDSFAQFVFFKTAGNVPAELFQQSWIPIAKGFLARGITNIILSARVGPQSDLSKFTFVSKNWWDSVTAIKGTFPKGLPGPSKKGNINVSQGGIFKVEECSDLIKHQLLSGKTKNTYKILIMVPIKETPAKEYMQELKTRIQEISGYDSLCVYRLDPCSGDLTRPWFYSWIIEAYFHSHLFSPDEAMDVFRDNMKLPDSWDMSIHVDDMQLTPQDIT